MEADHGLELGPTAPALELPWCDPEGRLQYVDLRGGPGSIELKVELIPEARQFPALRRFLIELNSRQSAWQTAKCDVWADQAEPAENLYDAAFRQSCYVDIVLAEPAAALRGSLELHLHVAKEMARMLEANEALEAFAEIVVRRCYFHHGGERKEESDTGYCLTLFLIGYGSSEARAAECLASAMESAAVCLLSLQPH